jgi:hypothetical protein
MLTVSSSFGTTKELTGYAPAWLLEFPTANLFYASRTLGFSGPWYAGEGLYASPLVFAGHQHGSYEARISSAGIGAISQEIAEESGIARVSNTQIQMLNQDVLSALAQTVPLAHAIAVLKLGFVGQGYSEYVPLMRGFIDNYGIAWHEWSMALLDGSLRNHRDLSVPVGGQYFPGTPEGNRGRAIPILVGVNANVQAIQVSGTAAGSLAFAISGGATACDLAEFGASFPSSGTITLGTETGVTYASRRLVNILGTTYLRLDGLVRSAGVNQALAAAVTLTSVQYVYLVGYQVGSIQNVRNDGVITLTYTASLAASGADRPVTLLTFTTPQGVVTVDTNAANVDTTNSITNGGFETGSASGWTASGATVAVNTTLPSEGTYKADVTSTGGANVYGDLYQDVTVIPGESYSLSLDYKNIFTNLLVNGGFETGDLTGWTNVSPTTATLTVIQNDPSQAGIAGGTAAEGSYALRCTVYQQFDLGFTVEIYQDVATTIGFTYAFSLQYLADFFFTSSGLFLSWQTEAGYKLGTPANASLYGTAFFGIPPANAAPQYRRGGPVTFVATTTTSRVTLLGRGFITGSFGTLIPPLMLDAALLHNASVIDESEAALQVGTVSDSDAYADVTLTPAFTWTSTRHTVRPTTDMMRVALRSKYTVTLQASAFDRVALNRLYSVHAGSGGENPAEAIAYILDTFVPLSRRNQASFDAAYETLINWKFGAILANPGESSALLQRMASQCKSILFEDAYGEYKLIPFDAQAATGYGFSTENIVADSLSVVQEPLDNMATHIYVWFASLTEQASSPDAFGGVVYATPDATTHPQAPLAARCQAAFALYGREHRIDVFADLVRDLTTAHLLLEYLVDTRTIRHHDLTLRSWFNAAPLELGDMVVVQHPLLPVQQETGIFQIRTKRTILDAAEIELTMREVRPAGWLAAWEYNPITIEAPGWSHLWEDAAGVTTGIGWSTGWEGTAGGGSLGRGSVYQAASEVPRQIRSLPRGH